MSTTPDLYCVMGNPIAHSRSPWIHARFAELTGQQLHYERRLVALDGFAQALRDFAAAGGRGCNITVPFKLQAADLADTRSARVQLAGAANTLVFANGQIHADNTDGLGIVIIAKHRNGKTGEVYFHHNQSMTKLVDYIPPLEWLTRNAK